MIACNRIAGGPGGGVSDGAAARALVAGLGPEMIGMAVEGGFVAPGALPGEVAESLLPRAGCPAAGAIWTAASWPVEAADAGGPGLDPSAAGALGAAGAGPWLRLACQTRNNTTNPAAPATANRIRPGPGAGSGAGSSG